MARRLYRVFHKYRAVEEVLTCGFDYWQEVTLGSVTDTVQEGCRQLAETMAGLWDVNCNWCRHRYFGCEVYSKALSNVGPGRYWALRNAEYGTAVPLADVVTLVLTAKGLRADGGIVRANTQMSLVPALQVDRLGLPGPFYTLVSLAAAEIFPAVVSVGSEGNFTRAALSKPLLDSEEIVTVDPLRLSGLYGSRIDRTLNRDNRGNKKRVVAPVE